MTMSQTDRRLFSAIRALEQTREHLKNRGSDSLPDLYRYICDALVDLRERRTVARPRLTSLEVTDKELVEIQEEIAANLSQLIRMMSHEIEESTPVNDRRMTFQRGHLAIAAKARVHENTVRTIDYKVNKVGTISTLLRLANACGYGVHFEFYPRHTCNGPSKLSVMGEAPDETPQPRPKTGDRHVALSAPCAT